MDAEAEREFREFVAARSAALYRSAYLLTGQREAAEDLLQGVLAKVARRWSGIRESPEAYTRRVLYHDQVSRWRRRSWDREVVTDRVDDRPAAGDHSATTDLRVSLAAALRRLTARQRSVVVLRYVEDLSEKEVATVLDISVGTVRSTAHRALARLRAATPELDLSEEAPR